MAALRCASRSDSAQAHEEGEGRRGGDGRGGGGGYGRRGMSGKLLLPQCFFGSNSDARRGPCATTVQSYIVYRPRPCTCQHQHLSAPTHVSTNTFASSECRSRNGGHQLILSLTVRHLYHTRAACTPPSVVSQFPPLLLPHHHHTTEPPP
jgi:hypothetical protein